MSPNWLSASSCFFLKPIVLRSFRDPYLSVICHNHQLHVLGHFKGLSFMLPKESESLVCLNTSPGLPAHHSCLSDNKIKTDKTTTIFGGQSLPPMGFVVTPSPSDLFVKPQLG